MSIVGQNLRLPAADGLLAGKVLRLGWSSIARNGQGLERVEFVLMLDVAGPREVTAEAWVERGAGRQSVLPRQDVAAQIERDGEMVHLDARIGRAAARLAITLECAERPRGGADRAHVVYAQTGLLENAGFAAGSYDRPTLTIRPTASAKPA